MKKVFKLVFDSIKRVGKEILYLGWTLAGTGLVLITLSSTTLRQGIIISVAGLGLHVLGVLIDFLNEREDNG